MIDRFIYKCCGFLDRYTEWMNNIFMPKPKKKRKKCQDKPLNISESAAVQHADEDGMLAWYSRSRCNGCVRIYRSSLQDLYR